jgi:hypothetical protein
MEGTDREGRLLSPGSGPIAAALFFLFCGVAGLAGTLLFTSQGREADGDIGSRAFPLLTSVILCTGSVLLYFLDPATRRRSSESTAAGKQPGSSGEQMKNLVPPALLMAGIVPTIGLFEFLGAATVFAGGVAAYLLAVWKAPWWRSLLIGLVSSAAVCLVFSRLLHIPLPGGILGWPR